VTCFLYVLPLAYENFLKVGISSDPLLRIRAFSRRYYESFDLTRTLLVEFDSRREAQARETALHRLLRPLNATQPITIPPCRGMAPPLRPVPAPRGTIGMPLPAASRTIRETCSLLRGNTTADGPPVERLPSYS